MKNTGIEIENNAGFCPGVRKAVEIAEKELQVEKELYCLGDIVHNPEEVKRLNSLGLRVINREEFKKLKGVKVLIRSHGEPPETYKIAQSNKLKLVDSTCKVVGNLQKKVKLAWENISKKGGKIVIFGKTAHPETIGLNGQINNEALIIQDVNETQYINFEKPVRLFSQTTMSPSVYHEIIEECSRFAMKHNTDFDYQPSVCGWMVRRVDHLKSFARRQDTLIFVAGEKSSNGAFLFGVIRKVNPRAHKISSIDQLKKDWLYAEKIGISGATSTPGWQLEEVAQKIEEIQKNVSA